MEINDRTCELRLVDSRITKCIEGILVKFIEGVLVIVYRRPSRYCASKAEGILVFCYCLDKTFCRQVYLRFGFIVPRLNNSRHVEVFPELIHLIDQLGIPS